MHRTLRSVAAALFGGLCAVPHEATAQQPVDVPFLTGLSIPVGFAFHGQDLMYIGERRGVIRVLDHGMLRPAPLLDIQEEVGGWRDYGMLGLALDPDFATNGFYYVSYVVDRHHLLHYGTPSYSATTDEFYAATITRITRFTADATTGFTTTVPGSRFVLFGESPSTGSPITYESHGSGQLVFGRDGTLLAAFGDGAHYLANPDIGSDPATYYQQALADGILRPEENVGTFRSQMLDSFAGKILRLDPATGDGVPSNPFYDSAHPRSARSRVYALGLRNPFRMTLRPGTGATDPALGRPGVLCLGDVGWTNREELNLVTQPGQNFGWPLFEGIDPSPFYQPLLVENLDVPNPLAGTGGCTIAHLRFQDLLRQPTEDHNQFFPNPCDAQVGIPVTTPTFLHTPPILDWRPLIDDARVPVFENGVLVARQVGTPESGVPGPQFHGGCSVAGCWHSGLSFPVDYGPCYYHADFNMGWILRLEFDAQSELVAIHDFGATTMHPLMLGEHPGDHGLLHLGLDNQLRSFQFGIEPPPVAVPKADITWGHRAFDVQLDARASYDPEGQPVTYAWDLGNGQTSTAPQLGVRVRGTGSPGQRPITLTVTDSHGASNSATVDVALDNSPPQVRITSFANGDTYSLAAPTTLPLTADVSDAEHGATQLAYEWTVLLHHNTHAHPEQIDTQPVTSTVLTPTPQGHEFFAYSVELKVTDAGGLATHVKQWLFPDTSAASTQVLMTSPAIGDHVAPGAAVEFRALATGSVQRVEYYVEGELVGVGTAPPYASTWTPTTSGDVVATALAIATDGSSSSTRGIPFTVDAPRELKVRVLGSAGDAIERTDQAAMPVLTGTQLALGDDGTPWRTGLWFALPTLPAGARVQEARLEFTAAQGDTGKAHLDISCDASPRPAPILLRDKNLLDRELAGPVQWTPGDWAAGDSFADQQSPDLAALLQPRIAHPKWQHDLLLFVEGTGVRHAVAWNGDPSVAPALVVRWLPPLPASGEDRVVADGNEDLGSGTVDLAGSMLHLGEDQGTPHLVALQFQLDAPAGAILESAFVRFTSAGTDTGPAVLTFRVEDTDDAPPLAGSPHDISTRPHVDLSTTWYPPEWPTAGQSTLDQRSPDLRELLQALIDRPGWQRGQTVVVFVEGSGSRTAASLNAGAASAPRLEFHYHKP